MIWAIFHRGFSQFRVHLSPDDDTYHTQIASKRYTSRLPSISSEIVHVAKKGSRLEVNVFIAFLKSIQFFEYHDRDNNVMLFKVLDAVGIVQNDVGVDNKYLRA